MSAKHTTAASGIGSMLRKADIDDFVFEPCGYSMNGCDGEGFSTIHVTPEEGFSYASLELSGYPAKGVDPTAIVTKVCPSQVAQFSAQVLMQTRVKAFVRVLVEVSLVLKKLSLPHHVLRAHSWSKQGCQ